MPAWGWQDETLGVGTIRHSLSWLKRGSKLVDSFYKTPAEALVRFYTDQNQDRIWHTSLEQPREALFLLLSPAFACKHITTVNTKHSSQAESRSTKSALTPRLASKRNQNLKKQGWNRELSESSDRKKCYCFSGKWDNIKKAPLALFTWVYPFTSSEAAPDSHIAEWLEAEFSPWWGYFGFLSPHLASF